MPARRAAPPLPPSPLRHALGETIRAHRTALGLSQETLSERAGLTQAYLSTVENGRRNPSLDALAALARALDMPLSALVAQAETHVLGR